MRPLLRVFLLIAVLCIVESTHAGSAVLPAPTSVEFCQTVQKIMAGTAMESDNTVFDNMPDYRASKPLVDPLQTFQVLTYSGPSPIMVSCKVKGAAHLRSAYGDDAAGEQQYCPAIARMVKAQAIEELKRANQPEAAAKAEAFVIDENEPFLTGRDYLASFELTYVDENGAIHFNSPGLFHDYDSWTTILLPERFEGQVYCHLATAGYMKALALGEMQAGAVITTEDDAPTRPQRR
jgi:hypothetical protein